jgi:hypothetical protein
MLGRRREAEVVPNYSLTGDLLSFMRCGLQYRYQSGSSLPPSRPVQMWFGEFIHGVMETAYRTWLDAAGQLAFPWPCNPTLYHQTPPSGRLSNDIGTIGDIVEATLHAAGKSPRSRELRDSAYRRAERAVNELGPNLFPLVSSAEEKVIGTRQLVMPSGTSARAQMYELHGVMDVLSSISIAQASNNFLCEAVQRDVTLSDGASEIIVDYKGSRRPPIHSPYWEQGDWQIQMYSWLRARQPNARPVVAGVLLYINELEPSSGDIRALQSEVRRGSTDVPPATGSRDDYLLDTWQQGAAVPNFSREFRLARMMRVIPITQPSVDRAVSEFDRVVVNIESAVAAEAACGRIGGNWRPCGDEGTCNACDFRHFCPSPFSERSDPRYTPRAPDAP